VDKLFKIEKDLLIQIFQESAKKLDYAEIEFNPVIDKLTYIKKGSGLQWLTKVYIEVKFTEKNGYTNVNFSHTKTQGLSGTKKAIQKFVEKWYSELLDLALLISNKRSKEIPNSYKVETKAETKAEISKNLETNAETTRSNEEENISEIAEKYKEYNKNKKNKKVLIITAVIIVYAVITLIVNSATSINACDCIEAMAKSKNEVYNKCIKQDYDKAFDYWESINPNRKFQNQEAVIQAYWMEKCN
jgi:hypothetical protein